MNRFLLLLALLMLAGTGYGQKSSIKAYRIVVKYVDERPELKGYLYNATDSSISVIPTNKKYEVLGDGCLVEVPVTQIAKIKRSVRRAAIVGFMPGAAFGLIMGGAGGAFWGETKGMIIGAVAAGVFFGTTTSAIAVAFTSKKYKIDGDVTKYRAKHLSKLKSKAIVVGWDDVENRGDLWYRKGNYKPFTGSIISWWPNGQMKAEINCDNGKIVSKKEWDEDGNRIEN